MRKILNSLKNISLIGIVYAVDPQNIPIKPPGGFGNLENITLPGIISTLIKLVLVVAALIAFFYLVWGGIKWITSGGDKDQTAKAQGTITAALVGLVIVFAAWAIIKLLEQFFDIQILSNLNIPQIPK